MREVYIVNEDATITAINALMTGDRPWFVSPLAAAVHGGVNVTCFTKEGIRAVPFVNPQPDPHSIPDEGDVPAGPKSRYYVQMTGDGEIFAPPASPAQAAAHYQRVMFQEAEIGRDMQFDYEPSGTIPELNFP